MRNHAIVLLMLWVTLTCASCTVPVVVSDAPATIPDTPMDTPSLDTPHYSGIAAVDGVIGAVLADGAQAVAELAHFTEIGCTTRDGLGGPPKCPPGQPEDTPLSVLPVWAQEGTYLTPETMDTLRFHVGEVYAVYRLPEGAVRDSYTPPGDYGIVFLNAEPFPATITVYVTAGRIVRLSYNMDTDPAQTLAQTGGEILYHAPDAAAPLVAPTVSTDGEGD